LSFKETALAIDELPELTAAQRESRMRLNTWLDALKSPDPERIRIAMQEFLAASQRKREVWLAMATPRPTTE
jgi:hypothetical protein